MAPSEFSWIMFVVNPRACLKFQANVFDRSRCQNCFKAFDLHRKDCGRDDNQLQYGGPGPNLHTSAFKEGGPHFISPDWNLYCGTSPEEVTASWQAESRMHNPLTSQIRRKWSADSSSRISELSSTAGSRGCLLRGEWTPGSNVSTLQGESRNRDLHTESPTWAQSCSRTNSVGSRAGTELVSAERVTGRKPRVESGYFSLERAKSDSVHSQSPDGRRAAEARSAGGGGGLLNLGRLTSSQSSFESGSSWGTASTVGNPESRLLRRDYTALADIPKPKRIIGREKLEQDCKQLGQRTRTRSPGREEVERLFGQQRRPVTEAYRDFIPTNVGRAQRESTISHRLEEESSMSKVYPRRFQQKETDREGSQRTFSKSRMRDASTDTKYDVPDRGVSKQASSFSMKINHRYLTQQRDKVDTRVYSQKEELTICTKCSRFALEVNKVDGRFSKEDSSSYTGYLQSAAKKDNKFFSQSGHRGYLRSSTKRGEVEANFSERTAHRENARTFSRSDRVPTKLNSIEETSSCIGYRQSPLASNKAERGLPNRYISNSLNRDVRQQGTEKDKKTDRGFSNRATSSSLNRDGHLQTASKHSKPDLLNFKKGWMSILGDSGEWKKHWFVLTDCSLRYYRDSTAEEANDLDGEIDLRNCSNVTEYQVQRNYGFQIHTKELVYTLSAMTSGIRRNWIEALRKNVRPNSSPDVTNLTDSNKENTFRDVITRRTTGRQEAASAERTWGSRRADGHEQRLPAHDCVELEPVQQPCAPEPADSRVQDPTPASTRIPEPALLRGQDSARADELQRDQAQRITERSRWFESTAPSDGPRKETDWSFEPIHIPEALSKDIEVKWQELERIPLRDHKQVPLVCVRPSPSRQNDSGTSATTERLEKEISTLNQQLDETRKELETFREQSFQLQGQLNASEDLKKQTAPKGFISQATCERSFMEMEKSHQKAMEELQRQHQRELERVQQEKEQLLSEETNATIAAIEAVKKAHREELEREMEKMRCTQSIAANSDLERLHKQHQKELQVLQRELQVLSEQYSRKCREIDCQVKETQLREKDLSRSQQENKELLRQNQELNSQLLEEIARIRELVTGKSQDSTATLPVTGDRDSCELEMLLRVKENEVQNLRKETLCLRDELQTVQWDKKYATDRYNDIFVELSVMKVRTERELCQVKEQLKLALSALNEKTTLQDSGRK
ncbi:TRIO and F-actin binding protein b isoform X3 [Mobula hypostoma]|uniref:TRIO and F-actin binding protein b isoform X3 n=1 Tax=Mobula hypostoma TaxID=723540 RepID=UPI002FC2C025